MNWPRRPCLPTLRQQAEEFSLPLTDLANRSPWRSYAAWEKPNHLSWRSTLSLQLRNVPLEPTAAGLWSTLQRIAAAVTEQALTPSGDLRGRIRHWSFGEWFNLWREQFAEGHDPVRAMVASHCPEGDASTTAEHFAAHDGLAFADFVLEAVNWHDGIQQLRALFIDGPRHERSLPSPIQHPDDPAQPLMERVCYHLYSDFRCKVLLKPRSARPKTSIRAYVANIYPCGIVVGPLRGVEVGK